MREAYIPAGNRWNPYKYPGEHTGMVFLQGLRSPGYFLGFNQKTGSLSLGVILNWFWQLAKPAWLEKSVAAFAADCEVVNAASGTTFHGPEGYKRFIQFFAESFPDLRKELTKVFATEEQVVLEGIFRGITIGSRTLSNGALKASGHPGEVQCCDVLQFKQGKIVSLHCYYDMTRLLEHFGLKPATAEAG